MQIPVSSPRFYKTISLIGYDDPSTTSMRLHNYAIKLYMAESLATRETAPIGEFQFPDLSHFPPSTIGELYEVAEVDLYDVENPTMQLKLQRLLFEAREHRRLLSGLVSENDNPFDDIGAALQNHRYARYIKHLFSEVDIREEEIVAACEMDTKEVASLSLKDEIFGHDEERSLTIRELLRTMVHTVATGPSIQSHKERVIRESFREQLMHEVQKAMERFVPEMNPAQPTEILLWDFDQLSQSDRLLIFEAQLIQGFYLNFVNGKHYVAVNTNRIDWADDQSLVVYFQENLCTIVHERMHAFQVESCGVSVVNGVSTPEGGQVDVDINASPVEQFDWLVCNPNPEVALSLSRAVVEGSVLAGEKEFAMRIIASEGLVSEGLRKACQERLKQMQEGFPASRQELKPDEVPHFFAYIEGPGLFANMSLAEVVEYFHSIDLEACSRIPWNSPQYEAIRQGAAPIPQLPPR